MNGIAIDNRLGLTQQDVENDRKIYEENEKYQSESKGLNPSFKGFKGLPSENSKYLLKEIALLRDFVNEIPESLNKGMHLNISNSDAERLVLYTYIILGDIILETK